MEKWGRELVQKCDGLPLAIVVLGGVLVTKPTFVEWQKVYKDSLSFLKQGKGFGQAYQKEVFHILRWSYNALPAQLKPCFLYLGKFKEDEEIDVETLYQLWIAEGMVLSSDRRGEETMMEVAKSYMAELVHKSMVQVKVKNATMMKVKNSQKEFKSCRLHDLMRDLSLHVAREEGFFKVINLERVNEFLFDSSEDLAYTRQVVIYGRSNDDLFHLNPAYKKSLRSILYFPCDNTISELEPECSGTLSWNVAHFRFLKVFVMEEVDLPIVSVSGCLFYINPGRALGSLFHLRYLSLELDFVVFPSIQNLELLQTLKLRADSHYHNIYFPRWISTNILRKLGRLQHLYLPRYPKRTRGRKLRFDNLSKLEILEDFDPRWCEVKDLAKLTNLRKLKANVSSSYDDMEEIIEYLQAIASFPSSSSSSATCFPYISLHFDDCNLKLENGPHILRRLLSHPRNLYELSISGKIPELVPLFGHQQQHVGDYIDSLSSSCITSLTLTQSDLEDDPMPVLEKLPVLCKLWLIGSFRGKKMICSATGFPQLTYLEMSEINELTEWRIEEGSIPNLSCLIMSEVRKLEELPEGLKFLKNLTKVCLMYMSEDLCDRVRVVNGEHGPDFYKVAHVPSLVIIL